jgi:predicted ester cyclase
MRYINVQRIPWNERQSSNRFQSADTTVLFKAEQDMAACNRPEAHRALYARYMAVCNAHDFAGMEDFYIPNISINDQTCNPRAVTAQFKELVAAFPDWQWEIRHLGVEGDFLHLHFRVTGTHNGIFRGIEPTGRKVGTQQFTLYQVAEGGKFAAVWDLTDLESVTRQVAS